MCVVVTHGKFSSRNCYVDINSANKASKEEKATCFPSLEWEKITLNMNLFLFAFVFNIRKFIVEVMDFM
jgi:hypothetical protein